MLRYRTETRPGLVTLYYIWPGNGAGKFLQLRSPHGASWQCRHNICDTAPKTQYTSNNCSIYELQLDLRGTLLNLEWSSM